MELLQDYFEFDSQLHSFRIFIDIYDGFFEIKSDVDWLSDYSGGINGGNDKPKNVIRYGINCIVEENPSTIERTGSITFTQDNLSKTVTVKQAGKQ